VRAPLNDPNLAKFDYQLPALITHLQTSEPVHVNNPAQYGPIFFFIMHPLLRVTRGDRGALAAWLYALQIVCLAFSVLLTTATIKTFVASRDQDWPLVLAWLLVLWLNFSPLYTILRVRSVEVWELLLMSLALYAYLRQWQWNAA